MRIRYVPADPAGNLTALVLTPVAQEQRASIAARLMRAAGMEQAAFIDEESLLSPLPRMDMMGGEFCGNATRAFGLYAARRRNLGEHELLVRVSGAREPVRVTLDRVRDRAFAHMPLPIALETISVAFPAGDGIEIDAYACPAADSGENAPRQAHRPACPNCNPDRRETRRLNVPVVRMEGIAHAVLLHTPPSPALAQAVLQAMPSEDAQGVLFTTGKRMTPLVHVAATGTSVWESSCGSGSVALAWLLSRNLPDGRHAFSFEEPGGTLEVSIHVRSGRAVSAMMGGRVTLAAEREADV